MTDHLDFNGQVKLDTCGNKIISLNMRLQFLWKSNKVESTRYPAEADINDSFLPSFIWSYGG